VNSGTTSARLRRKIELVLPTLSTPAWKLLNHPHVTDVYPEYMITASFINRTALPLMEAALGQAQVLAPTDPVAAELAAYLTKHIQEEADEDFLADLEVVGVDRAAVRSRPTPPSMAALIGSQYYWILHEHPVALLGYLEVVEGYPPVIEGVEELIIRTGHPREAFRQLIEHAYNDIGHRRELDKLLDTLPLTPQQEALLGVSALQTVHLLSSALDQVFEQPLPVLR